MICALVFASACSDDKGSTESETGTTPATTTATTGGATMTDPSGGTTSQETTDPGTSTPTSDSPTTTDASTTNNPSEATTGMTTEDPTAGDGGNFCQESCMADTDCYVGGVSAGLTCQNNRCVGMMGGCANDNTCRATFSGWVTPCGSQADCPGQACIDIGGEGRCAFPSNGMCEAVMQEEVMVPVIEGGMEIAVCANTQYVCEDEVCRNPCDDNLECGAIAGHPQCNVGTGTCECTSDDDCKNSGQAGYAVCNDGTCGCAVDADCTGAYNADVCTKDGFCGCSSPAACTTKIYDGTMSVCEGV